MYDAVFVFAIGLQTLDMSPVQRSTNNTTCHASCRAESPWQDGLSLINYMNSVGEREKAIKLHQLMSVN